MSEQTIVEALERENTALKNRVRELEWLLNNKSQSGFIQAHKKVLQVCENFGISPDLILGKGRTKQLAYVRSEAAWEVRNMRNGDGEPVFSFPEIGRVLQRDHTTVIALVRRAARRRAA